MSLKEVFVQNLKTYRKSEGISQMKLAELCKTDVSYIGQIEMGKRFPSIKLIEKIAEALNVEAYYFFIDREKEPLPEPEGPDFIAKLSPRLRGKLIKRISAAIDACLEETLNTDAEIP